MKSIVFTIALLVMSLMGQAQVRDVKWDAHSLMIDGKRVVPAMGEVHYSRIPADEWPAEVRKMKEGGITIIACYVFWNHIEEQEGQFDWSGQRNLRTFLEICQKEALPVVLRMGPFCHGEARCGGIPDWLFSKGCQSRTEDPLFLKYVERFYRQIFMQVQGLQWKEGGPVMAAQFDNEYSGHGSYLMALKNLATIIGFDLPFYTRTGWPELKSPVPFGEMIPLYGDYADGFWDRSFEEGTGNYYKAFNFREFRSSTAIATEQLKDQKEQLAAGEERYPYFTCELGGGMMTAYHRRPYLYPEDAYAMAVVKLGSGSNLLGYYMYHGGTNPESKLTYLNEMQKTPATNWNDLPVKTYDFQAPLNEFGQKNPHYYMLRKLHLFMQDYGELLAPMETVFPCKQDIPQGDDSFLRWSVREKDGRGFIFINNYERLQTLSTKKNVQLEACNVKLPLLTIPAGTSCIFPVNIDGIRYATAQIITRRDGKVYLEQIKGIPTEIAIDGKVLRHVKAEGLSKPVYKNIYLLDSETAGRLFLSDESERSISVAVGWQKQKEADGYREITIGVAGVAEEPSDADFEKAAVYTIDLPDSRSGILNIRYYGDCARLYADGQLIDDNFYNGRVFQYALWRLPKDCRQLELRILPIQKDMPVYFPKEANVSQPGERVDQIDVTVQAQKNISLDGEWQMTIGDKEYQVTVPHTYNVMEGLEDYAGEAVYRRTLPVTEDMKGKTVRIHFDAVYHDAIVFVNGKKVGEHLNKGYTPFSFDITQFLNLKGENTLEVRTSNAYTEHGLPYKRHFDWSNDGGIYRSVRLHVSGKQTIRYVHVTPLIDGKARFDIRLWDDKTKNITGHFLVKDRQTGEMVFDTTYRMVKPAGEKTFSAVIHIDDAKPWHFDHPNLYDFTFTIPGSDSLSDHFGFREFGIDGRTFFLNGEKVRLPGIEDMPGSNPEFGMAEPREFIEKTVRTMKDLNTTITRFHYVPDTYMIDLMDEMGILNQLELSWWQQPWKELTPELRQTAKEALEEMIEAYYNHPSIYGWGISNEVAGNHEEVKRLADVVRELDNSRIVDVLCNKIWKELANDPSLVLDLPTWNEYTGTWHGNNREELPLRFARIDSVLQGRPLFITENGLCEPAFAGGDGTRIDDMLYHIKEWQKAPFVCGYIYFCVQDYRTQMGEEGLGKYRIRRHGVTRTDLTPKPSYHVLRQLMSPIEITKVSPANAQKKEGLAGQYDTDDSNRDAAVVLQVKNSIPTYTLRGYQLKFADGNGKMQTISLPDMLPGESYPLVLKDINAKYSFEILRPTGFSVIEY